MLYLNPATCIAFKLSKFALHVQMLYLNNVGASPSIGKLVALHVQMLYLNRPLFISLRYILRSTCTNVVFK